MSPSRNGISPILDKRKYPKNDVQVTVTRRYESPLGAGFWNLVVATRRTNWKDFRRELAKRICN